MIHENELSFHFGDYVIQYGFQVDLDSSIANDDSYYSFNIINDIEGIDAFLKTNPLFVSYNIRKYEGLKYREENEEDISISFEMNSFVKKIKKYSADAIKSYTTSIMYDDGYCEPINDFYFYEIEFASNFFYSLEFAEYIMKSMNSEDYYIPEFYATFFRNSINIKDNKIVPIVSTNTKVRRLGYFKILSLFLKENKKVPVIAINKKFENYCLQYQVQLMDNQFKKGLISETRSGISAKPYIDIANDLDFLNKINNVFYTGKPFKVYQTIQTEFSNTGNIFQLNNFDKIYFLECILRNDYFYFSNLLEILFIEEKITYSDLVKKNQNQLIKCLGEYKKLNTFENRKALMNIDAILLRIKKWEKADVYLEHILMPRLNWMLDLDIVSGTNNEYIITDVGSKLFQHLCIWNDINMNKIISSDAFLDRFMLHMYDDCYNNEDITNPKKIDVVLDKMYQYIENSFEIFKTLAPNRVTASQAANYTKYKLYLNDKIKVGYQFILGKLSEKGQDKFIFKYQEQYQDGYIQKKN